NAVRVNPAQGNWCEGLTSFLADHAYRRERGEGVADRKESITKYLSYVHPDSGITLADFDSASHHQPMAEAKRAVGYIRGAFLFHELQHRIGEDVFNDGLRLFYRNYLDKEAAWEDLRRSFEQASGLSLARFFNERLHRTELPALAAENVSIEYEKNHPVLSFTLVQQTTEPFSLVVPIEVDGMAQRFVVDREISAMSTEITLPLDRIPLGFRLDSHYDVLRQLTKSEYPAVWSRFLGAEKKLAVVASTADRKIYQPLLDAVREENFIVTTADAVSNKELAEYNLLFLGLDQPPSRTLFGLPDHASEGFSLDTRTNPLNSNFVAVLVSSSSAE
ncbi:MAG: M1 family aminopeptidase, partial [Desulforhopalus sp.]